MDAVNQLSSHSLKATLLSYFNKWGGSLASSELLGYHVNKEHQSALNYTRDCVSGPMREWVRMLDNINTGAFCPDAERDAMFPEPDRRVTLADAFLNETGLTVADAARVLMQDATMVADGEFGSANERLRAFHSDDRVPTSGMVIHLTDEEGMTLRGMPSATYCSSDDSSSSSTSEGSEIEEEAEVGQAIIEAHHDAESRALPSESSDTMCVYRHSRTKMLHYGNVHSSDKTGCGRMLSEAYYAFKSPTDLVFPKCKVCFGHMQV